MDVFNRALALAGVFGPLSFATIGGGIAIVADAQRQIVDVHHWMTAAQFVDNFAISRVTPGPGSLLATLIGWQVAGFCGALAATIGIFGPTAFLIYGVAHVWRRHKGARWTRALETGLRPVAAGMILATVYVLMSGLDGGWWARAIALASTAIVMYTRVNTVLLIGAGAALLVVIHGF